MKSVKFLRINDVSQDDAAAVDRHFAGYTEHEKPEELNLFDYSLVHMLSSQKWMTVEDVVAAAKRYNAMYPDDPHFSENIGYVTLSLIKMVECGLATLRIQR